MSGDVLRWSAPPPFVAAPAIPMAHVPLTPLPLVREVGPPQGELMWLAAGGRIVDGKLCT